MSRKRLNVDWGRVEDIVDFNPFLERYKNHLIDIGLRHSTVESYVWLVKSLPRICQDRPANDSPFCRIQRNLTQEKPLEKHYQ
jgi:hypothetical protein